MKDHSEKQPIDDLFARKLGDMSLKPSADGFERLQARMNQNKPEAHVVFWRNPAMQRYMAVAACLILVCLFGWLYQTRNEGVKTSDRVASNQLSHPQAKHQASRGQSSDQSIDSNASKKTEERTIAPTPIEESLTREELAYSTDTKAIGTSSNKTLPTHRQPKMVSGVDVQEVTDKTVLAHTKPADSPQKNEVPVVAGNQTSATPTERLADNATKPVIPSERVLVVTIGEPESLVAARQVAKEATPDKAVATTYDKPESEGKSGGLWQQVKRIKQGEIFARRDNTNGDDERGLLGRAYNGLKHNLDKDKSAKQ